MVPEGWTEEYVKGLVRSLDAGVSVNSEDDGNENATHKILKTSCVSYGYFKSDETKSVIEQSEIARLREPVIANSIIISRMNTPALVGANAYVEIALNNTYLPDRLWQLKPKNKVVEMRWLAYWLGSAHTRYRLSNLGTGTSGSMKNITKSDVLNLALLVPPLPEQKKIAQILSTWDKAITTTEQLLANSQQQKKALMQQLLTGKKRLLDENGVRFSGEWEKFSFSQFGKCIRGVSYKPGSICSSETQDTIRLLRSTNIQNGRLNDEGLVILPRDNVKLTQILKSGDLAICMANGSKALVGKSAPYSGSCGLYTVGAFCAIFRPHKNVNASFVKFLFESSQYQSQLLVILAGSSINNLKGSDIEAMKIFAPANISEQKRIASALLNADNEISSLNQKLEALKQEKKALMQQLLTGKRRVKVDEEAA